MHKRSEVDLRVAQELKNHQDFIYDTNQALQNLSQNMLSISQLFQKVVNKSESDRKEVLVFFEILKEMVTKKCEELNQRVGNLETNYAALRDSIWDKCEEFTSDFVSKDELIAFTTPKWEELDTLQEDLVTNKNYFNTAVTNLRSYAKDQAETLRKELTPVIPKVDPIKKQLDERLSVFKVDFDGLVREIALLKKAVAYDEKKFENIYTLIERLKAGKE